MKVSQVLAFVVTAAASAGIVAVVMTTCQQPSTERAARPASGSRQPIIVGQPISWQPSRVARSLPVESPTRPEVSDSESRGLDEFPTASDFDKDHPGIAAAYREARDAVEASLLAREERRCFRQHARGQKLVEWSALQTFTVDATHHARLSGLALMPTTPGIQPFLDCISKDLIGKIEFPVPEGTPETFALREGGGRLIRSESKVEDITSEVAALSARLQSPELSPSQRSLLEQQLALWKCYAERGPDKREQCQRDFDGD